MLYLVLLNSFILLITISLRNACGLTHWDRVVFLRSVALLLCKAKNFQNICVLELKNLKKNLFAGVLSLLGMLQPQLLGLRWTDDARSKGEGRKGDGSLWLHKDTGREARWGIQACENLNISAQPKERTKIYWI